MTPSKKIKKLQNLNFALSPQKCANPLRISLWRATFHAQIASRRCP
jgi:hypothetical protein